MESTVTEEYFQEFKNMGEVSSTKCHRSMGERKCIIVSHINISESFNGIFKKKGNKMSRVNEIIIQELT